MAGDGHLSGAEGRPREEIEAGSRTLRRHRPSDTAAILEAVNESLAHLAVWMSWAQVPATDESIGTFLAGAVADFEDGTNFGYAITERDATGAEVIVGGCGLHPRVGPGGIEIGYWVHAAHLRRGIAKAAAVALRDQAFAMGLDRVEIHCDEQNTASAAVARSAGFDLIGTETRSPQVPSESDVALIWRSPHRGD